MTEYSNFRDIPKEVRNGCKEAASCAGVTSADLFNSGGYFKVQPDKSVIFMPIEDMTGRERELAKKNDHTRILVLPHERTSGQKAGYWETVDRSLDHTDHPPGRGRKYRGKHRSHNKGKDLRNLLNVLPKKHR